ncbi:MAG: L-rhamnose mutarotase [Lautropia sp.]|nr:L-rhamnose mutarotase [Lautropia sp.]
MLHVKFHDLQDDPALIAEYEAHHVRIWPEVSRILRRLGVTGMDIHRLGTRMVMLMHTDDQHFDPERFAAETAADPTIQAWETLMNRYQAPTPWTPPGEKWVEGQRIFSLADQPLTDPPSPQPSPRPAPSSPGH